MRIDFIFDTVCPWCYVGKRRLKRALAMRPDARADIRYRPFLLNPDLPIEGIDRAAYLDRKFGGPGRVQRVHAAVAQAGKAEGIEFDFERIARTPNSLNSHRLVRFAAGLGREDEVVEAIYRAYFRDGQDIGTVAALVDIAASVGLPAGDVAAYLDSDADISLVMHDNARFHRLGVNGVPSIILDGTYAVAGAQEPDIILRLLDVVRENEAEAVS